MMRKAILLIAGSLPLLATANPVFAQSESLIDGFTPLQISRVMTNAADEFAMCSAFYQIVSECMNNTKPKSGEKYEQLSLQTIQKSAFFLSYSSLITLQEAGEEYDAESIAVKSMQSVTKGYERYKQEMLDEVQTCQNLSLLYTKHLEPCNSYFQNQEILVEKWVHEIASE